MTEEIQTQVTEGAESLPAGDSQMFTQEQLDSIVGKTRKEERAKYAHYDEYKAAFEELEKLKESQKSDLDKALERAESAEAALNAIKHEKERATWRAEISADTGVPEAAINGDTKEEMEECAERLRQYFPQNTNTRPYVESDGFAPSKTTGKTTREQFAESISNFI